MTQKINSKSTKVQIMEAYEELQEEKATLEAKLKQLEKTQTKTLTTPQPQETPKTQAENKPMKTPIYVDNNIILIIENLEKLQTNFGSAVSNLSEQLITEASSLEDLQDIFTEELEQLNELHDLETVEDDTLDTLIQSYEASSKTFQEELNQQKNTLEKQVEELQKAWVKEKETHQIETQERDQNHLKTKQRDEEEYQYNLQLERNLDQETYEQQKKALYQELADIKSSQEKQWKEREESIAKREKDYQEVKLKADNLEQELDSKIKQAKEQGKGIGIYQAKIKADLRNKEIEGEKQNYQLRIAALEQTLNNQEVRIQSLTQQLEASLKQVQDLAVKAIEGTSNRSSFEAMKEIALEQAKNQQKGK
ncbi:conserved hypothetical protein [Rippkaea orientalis PCC 8801]|uniref:Myosin heavy chain n=1 Tax=Rippkaea orientalis (strain PCC 8801 / RF-1) TaxID=41431 RepID=B7K392_RIPO1|nr:hypothetical protein [Rippkaea orientalis]ACK64412.1 conserved hypothetical protein [Rippkaea orientalis PCC 8801]